MKYKRVLIETDHSIDEKMRRYGVVKLSRKLGVSFVYLYCVLRGESVMRFEMYERMIKILSKKNEI